MHSSQLLSVAADSRPYKCSLCLIYAVNLAFLTCTLSSKMSVVVAVVMCVQLTLTSS